MESNSKRIHSVLVVIFWIAFVGCCINTGVFFVGHVLQLARQNFQIPVMELDFSPILAHGKGLYYTYIILNTFVLVLICYLLYQVLQLFRLFKVEDPFHKALSRLLRKTSTTSLYCGFIAIVIYVINRTVDFHGESAVDKSDIFYFLLLSAVLYLIASVFKKGESLQQENELTV